MFTQLIKLICAFSQS